VGKEGGERGGKEGERKREKEEKRTKYKVSKTELTSFGQTLEERVLAAQQGLQDPFHEGLLAI
jgi:hypothetical protein